jgi:hypothetical protein
MLIHPDDHFTSVIAMFFSDAPDWTWYSVRFRFRQYMAFDPN